MDLLKYDRSGAASEEKIIALVSDQSDEKESEKALEIIEDDEGGDKKMEF